MHMSRLLRRVAVLATIGIMGKTKLASAREQQKVEEPRVSRVEDLQKVALGIDLGTTNSVISFFDKNKNAVETIQINNKVSMPSFIKMEIRDEQELSGDLKRQMERVREKSRMGDHYYYNGMWISNKFKGIISPIVGWPAMEKMKEESSSVRNYIYRFKPLLARNSNGKEDRNAINATRKNVKYGITSKRDESLKSDVLAITITDNDNQEIAWVTPKSLSTMVLEELRQKFEEYWHKTHSDGSKSAKDMSKSRKCVVTVPAYFNNDQKEETRDAAMHSLLDVYKDGIINEPTSAAIAYAYTCARAKKLSDLSEKNFLVFDFGGGTLDMSYLSLGEEGVLIVESHVGDNFLGGENVNDLIYEEFQRQLKAKYSVDPASFPINASLRLRALVEEMKIELCNKQNIVDDAIRKEALRNNTTPDYSGTNEKVVKELVIQKGASGNFLNYELELSANTMQTLCTGVFAKISSLLDHKVSANSNDSPGLMQKLKSINGKDDIKHILYVGGSSRLFGVRRLLMTEFPKADHCFDLDPDTCVSVGAAYYAASLEGIISDENYVVLVDAIPMNMGIKLDQDMFDVMAEAGKQVPNTFEKYFTTTVDAQKTVQIVVGQTPTQTKQFSKTKMVGTFNLDMPNNDLPRGKKRIKVVFDFGNVGDIEVTAYEVAENGDVLSNASKIAITKNKTKMTEEEKNEMKARYQETKEKEAKWLEKCEKMKELDEAINRIGEEASRLPDTHPKKKGLLSLHKENSFWYEREIKNEKLLGDEEMIQKVQDRLLDLSAAYSALSDTEAEKTEEAKPEAEEFIPREDL
ncbi:heat shock 70kDa protein 1/2/6/8 [Nematocida minor]|uniref:heat shock 70kDa protein 1/2/6/8 n=1 Tax=Nematocida minor TaxID=1912983 RepID=UPI00221EE08A|nr:heat shock 70kDa protein 1/2/6/8 [Nematocida minor]KAI5190091.1 heat shock 70kDa protein 1/2/6/8 [Nematocida minor]